MMTNNHELSFQYNNVHRSKAAVCKISRSRRCFGTQLQIRGRCFTAILLL